MKSTPFLFTMIFLLALTACGNRASNGEQKKLDGTPIQWMYGNCTSLTQPIINASIPGGLTSVTSPNDGILTLRVRKESMSLLLHTDREKWSFVSDPVLLKSLPADFSIEISEDQGTAKITGELTKPVVLVIPLTSTTAAPDGCLAYSEIRLLPE